ncbi:MAG: hypothetical protein HOG97_01610, partial [Candidatus Marinimicrobia bacterium]|nr:hypothetical protein [Candidatus Neomarinimicrobiota bacterium]
PQNGGENAVNRRSGKKAKIRKKNPPKIVLNAIKTAQKVIIDYVNAENDMIEKGNYPTVKRLYAFLDRMVDTFHDSHKDVLQRIGIKNLIRDEFLYLENKD